MVHNNDPLYLLIGVFRSNIYWKGSEACKERIKGTDLINQDE
jgi:hypothetical protein